MRAPSKSFVEQIMCHSICLSALPGGHILGVFIYRFVLEHFTEYLLTRPVTREARALALRRVVGPLDCGDLIRIATDASVLFRALFHYRGCLTWLLALARCTPPTGPVCVLKNTAHAMEWLDRWLGAYTSDPLHILRTVCTAPAQLISPSRAQGRWVGTFK